MKLISTFLCNIHSRFILFNYYSCLYGFQMTNLILATTEELKIEKE